MYLYLSSRAVIPVTLVVALTLGARLAEFDDHAWYLWQDLAAPEGVKAEAFWLPDYHADIIAQPIQGVTRNASGLTFDYDRQSLWVIVNEPAKLVELNLELATQRVIELRNFVDTEAVVYLGAGRFAIVDEREQAIVVAYIDEETLVLNRDELKQLAINIHGENNKGLEGIAFNAKENSLVVARERDPMMLLEISGLIDGQGAIEILKPDALNSTELFMDDFSGLHHDSESDHLLVLSEESRLVAEMDMHGNRISFMSIERGFSRLTESIPQAEGIATDSDGFLYIVSEPNLVYRFRRTSASI